MTYTFLDVNLSYHSYTQIFNSFFCIKVRILCTRSFPQLHATFEAYAKISGNDIEKAIKKEMSGDLERACLAIGTFNVTFEDTHFFKNYYINNDDNRF